MFIELIFHKNELTLDAGQVSTLLEGEIRRKLIFPIKLVSVSIMGKWFVVLIEIPHLFDFPPYKLSFKLLANEVAGLVTYTLQDYGVRYRMFEAHGVTSSLIFKKEWRIGTVALNCIVKDEGPNLKDFLKQIKPFVDEMVVVIDSRTTDNSAEIAVKCGARVFFQEWHDDFSELRNKARDETASEWILSLSVDEIPSEKLLVGLRDLVNTDKFNGYIVDIVNLVTKDTVPHLRIFRRIYGKWEGKVHEILRGIPEDSICKTDMIIEHLQRWITQGNPVVEERNMFYRQLENQK